VSKHRSTATSTVERLESGQAWGALFSRDVRAAFYGGGN